MEAAHDSAGYLPLTVVLLAAAVISVPLARFLKLSSVIAYLVAGVLIGPSGARLFSDPGTIIAVAELGVVMLLFLIGLELEVSRLIKLRKTIFGLGAGQLALCAAAIAGLALFSGQLGWRGAAVTGFALAMSATSITLKVLEERGHLQLPYGQKSFAVLLFQDMAVVPLLALLPLMSQQGGAEGGSWAQTLLAIGQAVGAIAAVVLAGRYLLNPIFRLLAETGAREVMTAAALLIVLGTALLMHQVGMSMALGAFLAGVLLAESNYRHELEADVEPFRGLLLALFFMGIGMGIDIKVVWANIGLIVVAALVIVVVKIAIVAMLFRFSGATRADGLRGGAVLTPAGEFAFVLLPLGVSLALMTPAQAALVTTIAAVTMLLSSPVVSLVELFVSRTETADEMEPANFDGVQGSVLMIGFGRFGQVVSQCLLSAGVDATIIDTDGEMIQAAGRFGFKVYYGDGTRLDVLRAAGAGKARLIVVCVDKKEMTDRIVSLLKAEFSDAKLYVRSFDRGHTLELLARGVDLELREMLPSALEFGRLTLEGLGVDPLIAEDMVADVRARDLRRLEAQKAEGLYAGLEHVHHAPVPQPLDTPKRRSRALNPEADELVNDPNSG